VHAQLSWPLSSDGAEHSRDKDRRRLPFVVFGYVLSRLGASLAVARAIQADMDCLMPTTTAFQRMNESLSRFLSLLWSMTFSKNWNSSFWITF
jgi:hypothetical protein